MSLMGIVMMVGIVVSNSILIVEFTHRLIEDEGMAVREAVAYACRVRLRPILMTSLATIFGLIPMALKLGDRLGSLCSAGPRHHRRLDRLGHPDGFLVPAAFLISYRNHGTRRATERERAEAEPQLETVP